MQPHFNRNEMALRWSKDLGQNLHTLEKQYREQWVIVSEDVLNIEQLEEDCKLS